MNPGFLRLEENEMFALLRMLTSLAKLLMTTLPSGLCLLVASLGFWLYLGRPVHSTLPELYTELSNKIYE